MLATTVVLMGGTGFAAMKTYSSRPKSKGAKSVSCQTALGRGHTAVPDLGGARAPGLPPTHGFPPNSVLPLCDLLQNNLT